MERPYKDDATEEPVKTDTKEEHAKEDTLHENSHPSSQDVDQSLHQKWNKVVDEIKKNKRSVSANLAGVAPELSKDGDRLTLEFPSNAATSKQCLELEVNQRLLSETVEKIFGRPMALRLVLAFEKSVPNSEQKVLTPAREPLVDTPGNRDRKESFSNNEQKSLTTDAVIPENEPSKEELESILSNSLNSTIRFEE
jgi:vancomycin resistance protein YoaR